jgi:hypothetical protein
MVRPSPDARIDEEQFFVLQLNGPATLRSVQANVWCVVEGLGERVPVKLPDGPQRAQLLKAQGLEKVSRADPLNFVTLACNGDSRLPPTCSWSTATAWPRRHRVPHPTASPIRSLADTRGTVLDEGRIEVRGAAVTRR